EETDIKSRLHLTADGSLRNPQNFAVSPDGKYLAFQRGAVFDLISTENGKSVGQLQTKPAPGGLARVILMAFRPDSQELIAVFDARPKAGKFDQETRMESWDVKTGQLKSGSANPIKNNCSAVLTWWGDNHVLLWHHIFPEAMLLDIRKGQFL